MGRSITVFVLVGVLLFSFTPSLAAYSKTLTSEDIQAAIEYGKSRRGQPIVDRSHPNYVSLDIFSAGFVMTPWLDLAFEAQKAAAKYQELSQEDIQRTLRQSTGKLTIGAAVIESLEDFWRDPHSVIIQDTVIIQPVLKRGTFSNVVSCATRPCTISAILAFAFPDDQLDMSREATLVIILRSGRKEFRASLNLPAMR